MWQEDEASLEWTTVAGFFARIEEWRNNANRSWDNDDLEGDAYLNFNPKFPLIATFDLFNLRITNEGWGEVHGSVHPNSHKIDIRAERSSGSNHLRCLWFHVGPLNAPPRQLYEVYKHLYRAQRKGLQRDLKQRSQPDLLRRSGGCDLILFCWKRNSRTYLLALACRRIGKEVEAGALMPSPQDEQSLILRAGPRRHRSTRCQSCHIRSRRARRLHCGYPRPKRSRLHRHSRRRHFDAGECGATYCRT